MSITYGSQALGWAGTSAKITHFGSCLSLILILAGLSFPSLRLSTRKGIKLALGHLVQQAFAACIKPPGPVRRTDTVGVQCRCLILGTGTIEMLSPEGPGLFPRGIFFILLFLEREGNGGRKRRRETLMHCLLHANRLGTKPKTQACALTGD